MDLLLRGGRVADGTGAAPFKADLAVFDPTSFGERGTTFSPNQTATGMVHVFVEGVHTVADGALTGDRGGRVLRRGSGHAR